MKITIKRRNGGLQDTVDKLNGTICSRNLYLRHNGMRYFNAHIENGKVMVEALYGGAMLEYVDGQFTDCNGQTVFVAEGNE